jgi:ubiquinone/menaquinone biosynthesis C-methylase UbiE
MKPILRLCFLLIVALLTWAQVAKDANKEFATEKSRESVAKRLSDPKREQRMKPKELIALLKIQPGSTVADVGTGTGMMLPHLSEAVGPSGRVIAEDIHPDFMSNIEAKIKSNNWSNVTAVQGGERNPNLPEGQVDLVFILDTYHHFDYPGEMLGHIARSMKPDARLAIVDFYRRGSRDGGEDMSKHVRADKPEVIKEIEANGWQLLSQQDHSDQYVLIFRRK